VSGKYDLKFIAVAFTLLAFSLPITGALANKGLTVILILLALASVGEIGRRGRVPTPSMRGAAALVAAILAWGGASALWSVDPAMTVRRCAELSALAAAGFLALHGAAALDGQARERVGDASLVAFLLAVAIVGIDLASGTAASRWVQAAMGRVPDFVLHKTACVILAMLCWPLAAMFWRRVSPWAGLAFPVAVAVTAWFASSRGTVLAMMVAGAVFSWGYRFPRQCLRGLQVVLAVMMLGQPLLLAAMPEWDAFTRDVPDLPNSAYHRYYIWKFTADKIADHPVRGWGLDSSRAIPGGNITVAMKTTVPWRAYPVEFTSEKLPLHPHNIFLQWWLELGGVGALLGLGMLQLLLLRVNRIAADPAARAAGFACIVSGVVIGAVSYGAWQSWWLSLQWLTIILFTLLGGGAGYQRALHGPGPSSTNEVTQ
jgi:exopolysaccharide production protein ExoQ